MKKFLQLLALLLTLAMIVPMMPVMTFAEDNVAQAEDAVSQSPEIVDNDKVSAQHASLTDIGQDIYSTGDSNYMVEEQSITVDGSVDQGKYVCVTPGYVTSTMSNSWANAKSDSSWGDGYRLIPVSEGNEFYNPQYVPNVKYYVAQSKGCIYLTVELTPGTTPADYYIAYFRFGFNPADYRQQLIGYSDNSEITVTSASDNTAKSTLTQGVLVTGKRSSAHSFEMQFNKGQIKAAYLEKFGVTLTDADLNSMFIGISLRASASSVDKARPFYGTLLTTDAASAAGQGNNTYIPDVIVFGEEKDTNATAFANCTFDVHCTADRYKVAGTTDTYYHSCAHCGAAGANTFKADANGIVFDKEVVSEDAAINAHTCAAAGTYFKSCSCGRVDTDTTNTFTYGGAHVYVEKIADAYLDNAATCKAGAIYKKSCKECGVEHETEIFTTAPLRWPAGTTTPITLDKDHTYFGALGQDVYTTGSNNYTSTSTITIDGAINADEGWVCVTPDGVDLTVSTGHLGTKVSSVAVSAVDEATVATYGDGQKQLIESMDVKYYVAQDDEYVYVAVKQSNANVSYAVSNKTYYSSNQVLAYLKLGFNPVDYTQQITLYSNGQFVNGTSAKGKIDGLTYTNSTNTSAGGYVRYPMVVKGLGDNDSFTKVTGFTGIVEDLYADSKFDRTTSGPTVRAYEMRLKKSAIKAQYDAIFGEGTSDSIDFSTMFIGGSYSDNVWTTQDTSTFYMVAGTLQTTDATKNNFIPDVVVFGEEKGMGCNYQGHIVDDNYAVPNTTDTYYHSCTECGSVGLSTFKVVDNKPVFSVMEEKEEFLVEGSEVDCTTGYMYYKQCECGFVSDETFEGSYRDINKHNYSEEYSYNGTYHWHACTKCSATTYVMMHVYDGASDYECNVCEYVREPSSGGAPSAPATEAPATEAPTTEAPTTEAPATEAPATEAPTTEAPATEAPATEAPATEAPATEAPATEAPATEAPATEAPATEAPVTEAPATDDGCNGAISLAGVAIVTMLGACAVVATKKKED